MRRKHRLVNIGKNILIGGAILSAALLYNGKARAEEYLPISTKHTLEESIPKKHKPRYNYVSLENKIKEIPKKDNIPNKFALIVRSDNEPRHIKNTDLAYKALLANEFEPKNIFILSYPIAHADYKINGVATKKRIYDALDYLSDIIDSEDLFIAYFNGHGNEAEVILDDETTRKTSTFSLKRDNMAPIELKQHLFKINPKQGILVFGFCYSGAFAEELKKRGYVTIASTSLDKNSYAVVGDSFDGYLFHGLNPLSRESDTDNDNKITLEEAIEYAVSKHSYSRDGKQEPVWFPKTGLDKILIR